MAIRGNCLCGDVQNKILASYMTSRFAIVRYVVERFAPISVH